MVIFVWKCPVDFISNLEPDFAQQWLAGLAAVKTTKSLSWPNRYPQSLILFLRGEEYAPLFYPLLETKHKIKKAFISL